MAYESMFKLILKYKNNLLEIFNTVGLIDSLISIASTGKVSVLFNPVLRNTNMLNKPCLNTEPGYPKAGYPSSISSAGYAGSHGLIGPTGSAGSTCPAGSPVPRPWLSFRTFTTHFSKIRGKFLSIDKHILVTGSNASGKSTFLKTIAINAIFAQTIHTCLAENMLHTSL